MLLKEGDTEEQKILKANNRNLRNRMKNKMKTTKASFYYHNSFIQSEGNARRTWKLLLLSCLMVRTNQRVNEVIVDDISICNSNDISNAFNEQFSTIYRAQTNPRKAFKFGRGVYLFKQYF